MRVKAGNVQTEDVRTLEMPAGFTVAESDGHVVLTTGGSLSSSAQPGTTVSIDPLTGDFVITTNGVERARVMKDGTLKGSLAAPHSRTDWPLTQWLYRKPITVDHTKVPGTVTNHLLAVDLSADADFLAKSRTDRSDVRFTDSAGNLLEHSWDGPDPSLLTSDGAWSWFTDPRAIERNGKLYVGWTTAQQSDIKIACWNLTTGALISSFTLAAALESPTRPDDHSYPSILFLADGRIAAFYSAHNDSVVRYRVSTNSEDVSAWGAEKTVPVGAGTSRSYSNPHLIGTRVYLFWRDWPSTTYSFCDNITAGSPSWNSPQTLISNPASGGQRPYTTFVSDGTTIHCFLTDAHPREYQPTNTSVYHFTITGGNVYKSDGTLIGALPTGTPLTFAQITKVYDGVVQGAKAWVWDVALQSGSPVGVFATMNPDTDHRYWYAKLTSGVWTYTEMLPAGGTIGGAVDATNEDQYSGGIAILQTNPNVVYVSRYQALDASWELLRGETADSGATWQWQQITDNTAQTGVAKNVRPTCPTNRSIGPEVVWMHGNYTTYIDYYTSLRCYPPLAGTGPTQARVRIPSVNASTDVSIYCYFGWGGVGRPPYRNRSPYSAASWKAAWSLANGDLLGDTIANLTGAKPVLKKLANASTTATGVNALNSATMNVGDTTNFAAAGAFVLNGTTVVSYTGKTGTTFTGCGNHAATTGGETIAVNVSEATARFGKGQSIVGGYVYGGDNTTGGGLNLAGYAGLTVLGWCKLLVLDPTDDYIFSNWAAAGGSPAASGTFLRLLGTSGQMSGVISVAAATVGGAFTDITASVDGAFHLYAITYDGTTLKGYKDGVVSGVTFAGGGVITAVASAAPMQIGASPHFYTTNRPNSVFDEVRIIDRALSANELLTEYRNLSDAAFMSRGALERV